MENESPDDPVHGNDPTRPGEIVEDDAETQADLDARYEPYLAFLTDDTTDPFPDAPCFPDA